MEDIIEAHKYSANHKKELLQDSIFACFYCGKVFHPNEIIMWVKDIFGTAVCPYCGIDSVIGESSGFPITEEFLERMHKRWF